MKRILFDARWYGEHGVGRFAREVYKRLDDATEFTGTLKPWHPLDCFYSALKLAGERGDVFFSPGYNSPLSNHSFAFTIHDLAHIDNEENRHPLKTAYYELIMKPACRRALKVFTVSEYSRARIAEWSGLDESLIINVGNGVGSAFTPDGERYRSDVPYVFCPCSRRPHKNEERTMRGFAAAYAGTPTKLLFLGLPTTHLLEVAHELGLASRVQFLGPVDDTLLASVYRGAEQVVFASLYEGFGLPVIESMACGAPVVTSSVCSLPEVAGGAALLVDPTHVEEIAEALSSLKHDGAERERLRELGLANARRFSWDLTGAKIRESLDEVR
ncbi:MAG TPA: glycosyltransferase family 1 protein [Polyangiales bacterium]|nr:glycosyltransferase family 1 protein [Polyangiales bacterium]